MQGNRWILGLSGMILTLSIGCSGGTPQGKPDAVTSRKMTRGDSSGAIPESRLEEIGFRTLWKTSTGGPIVQAWCVGNNLYVVRTGTDDPFVLEKLDGESGLTVWRYGLREKLDYPPKVYSYPSELRAVNPDELYIIQEDDLVGIDDRYGQKEFGVTLGFPVSTAAVPDQDHVYIGSWNQRMYAIHKKTRLEQWSYITDDSITAAPAVGSANVYFGSEDHLVYSLTRGGGYVPSRSWTLKTSGRITAEPLIYGDRIFVGSGDYKLYCLEDVGAEAFTRWSFPCGAPVVRRPFAFRDWVFAVTQETRPDGSLRWNVNSLGAVRGDSRWEAAGVTEVLAADAIHCYGLDVDGNIQALRLDSGQVNWTLEANGFGLILGQDARLGADKAWWGRMFLVGGDGLVQAIRPRR